MDAPHPLHQIGMGEGPEKMADGSGEVSNQLLGRMKSIISGNDVKFDVGAPTTVRTMQMA